MARTIAYVVDPQDLIDASGIAERYQVSRQTVSNWQRRNDDFPQPLETPLTRGYSIWDVNRIDAWMREHTVTVTKTVRVLRAVPSKEKP